MDIRSSGIRVAVNYSSLGPLQEQSVLLTNESSLHPHLNSFD